MSAKPKCAVVDTNVFLDTYLPGRPGCKDARDALCAAEADDVELLYTAGQAKDIFFLLGRALKSRGRTESGELEEGSARAINEICWAVLDDIEGRATVVGADLSDVWVAKKLKGAHRDFEDDLVIAAAYRAKADCIITNDEKLAKHSPVACLTPNDFVALLEAFEEE